MTSKDFYLYLGILVGFLVILVLLTLRNKRKLLSTDKQKALKNIMNLNRDNTKRAKKEHKEGQYKLCPHCKLPLRQGDNWNALTHCWSKYWWCTSCGYTKSEKGGKN